MKSYKITVNGTEYDVTVEEMGETPAAAGAYTAPAMPQAAAAPKTAAAPKAAAAPAAPKAAAGAEGNVKVSAPMPGKILSIKATVGATVAKGDVLMIIEAMKMENEIVAPEAGTVASISCAVGDSVEAGTLLASLNA